MKFFSFKKKNNLKNLNLYYTRTPDSQSLKNFVFIQKISIGNNNINYIKYLNY
jgi:hypothetical protein